LGEHSANGLLTPDTRLIIPIAASTQADTSTYAHATTRYKIRHGDTLQSISENFGVSVKMLRVWNRLKSDNLAGRRVLYLHLPVTATKVETQVASKHSTSTRATSGGANHTASNRTTQAHAAPIHSASGTQGGEMQGGATSAVLHHKVKAGETLFSIASSYNTSVTALKRDNRDVAILRPGMILVVRDVR
jgi:FOG: LysM repeat